jgi:hypothetical protein
MRVTPSAGTPNRRGEAPWRPPMNRLATGSRLGNRDGGGAGWMRGA